MFPLLFFFSANGICYLNVMYHYSSTPMVPTVGARTMIGKCGRRSVGDAASFFAVALHMHSSGTLFFENTLRRGL